MFLILDDYPLLPRNKFNSKITQVLNYYSLEIINIVVVMTRIRAEIQMGQSECTISL